MRCATSWDGRATGRISANGTSATDGEGGNWDTRLCASILVFCYKRPINSYGIPGLAEGDVRAMASWA